MLSSESTSDPLVAWSAVQSSARQGIRDSSVVSAGREMLRAFLKLEFREMEVIAGAGERMTAAVEEIHREAVAALRGEAAATIDQAGW
jgi:hypothetical protein